MRRGAMKRDKRARAVFETLDLPCLILLGMEYVLP